VNNKERELYKKREKKKREIWMGKRGGRTASALTKTISNSLGVPAVKAGPKDQGVWFTQTEAEDPLEAADRETWGRGSIQVEEGGEKCRRKLPGHGEGGLYSRMETHGWFEEKQSAGEGVTACQREREKVKRG